MRKARSTGEVAELEQQLMISLRKVDPNPQFVTHLHTRLTTPAEMQIEHRRETLAISLLIAGLALAFGVLLLWARQLLRKSSAPAA